MSLHEIAVRNRRALREERVKKVNVLFDELNELLSELYESVFDNENIEDCIERIKTKLDKINLDDINT